MLKWKNNNDPPAATATVRPRHGRPVGQIERNRPASVAIGNYRPEINDPISRIRSGSTNVNRNTDNIQGGYQDSIPYEEQGNLVTVSNMAFYIDYLTI